MKRIRNLLCSRNDIYLLRVTYVTLLLHDYPAILLREKCYAEGLWLHVDWICRIKSLMLKYHTRETVNLYAVGVLKKNKLTSSCRLLDMSKQSPSNERKQGSFHSTWVYLLTLYFVKNRRMSYAKMKFRDCNDTFITGNHRGFPEILFLATKMHALKIQYRGTWYRVCAIYSFSVEWHQLL